MFSIQLDGQYVAPSGMGGYARISGAKVDEFNGLGDLEVGGLYRIDRGATAVTIRGGLSLPTASDDFESFFTNYFAVLMSRPSDLISAVPDVTALRMSVAPTYRTGNVVLRGDFGFDVAVDSPGDSNLDPLYHADIGIGVQSGLVAGTAELATIGSTGSENEGTFHALSLGAQYDLGSVTPHATLAIPFDSEGSDSIEGYSLLVGLSGGL